MGIMELDIRIISGLFAYNLLAYFYFRNITKHSISKIGINDKYLSKYVQPNRLIKKHFKIKEKHIPRFLYIECYFSLFFIGLLIIEILIYTLVGYRMDCIVVLYILMIMKSILILFNFICFSVLCFLYEDRIQKLKMRMKKKRHSMHNSGK